MRSLATPRKNYDVKVGCTAGACYVFSDPVNFVDHDGLIIANLIGAAIGMAFEVINQIATNGWQGFSCLDGGKIAMAGLTGALGGFANTVVGAVVRGAVGNTANNAYQQIKDSGNLSLNYRELGRSAIGGGIGGRIGALGHNIGSGIENTSKAVMMIELTKKGARAYKDTGKITNYGKTGSAIGGVVGGSVANYY